MAQAIDKNDFLVFSWKKHKVVLLYLKNIYSKTINRKGIEMEKKLTVLVVDDLKELAELVGESVEDWANKRELECQVILADSLESGTAELKKGLIDLLITDLEMKGSNDGELLIMQFKGFFSHPFAKAILMTGRPGYEPPESLPADYFFPKPFRVKELFPILDEVLEESLVEETGREVISMPSFTIL